MKENQTLLKWENNISMSVLQNDKLSQTPCTENLSWCLIYKLNLVTAVGVEKKNIVFCMEWFNAQCRVSPGGLALCPLPTKGADWVCSGFCLVSSAVTVHWLLTLDRVSQYGRKSGPGALRHWPSSSSLLKFSFLSMWPTPHRQAVRGQMSVRPVTIRTGEQELWWCFVSLQHLHKNSQPWDQLCVINT